VTEPARDTFAGLRFHSGNANATNSITVSPHP
jgi:hypothetical protein